MISSGGSIGLVVNMRLRYIRTLYLIVRGRRRRRAPESVQQSAAVVRLGLVTAVLVTQQIEVARVEEFAHLCLAVAVYANELQHENLYTNLFINTVLH